MRVKKCCRVDRLVRVLMFAEELENDGNQNRTEAMYNKCKIARQSPGMSHTSNSNEDGTIFSNVKVKANRFARHFCSVFSLTSGDFAEPCDITKYRDCEGIVHEAWDTLSEAQQD